MPNQAIASWKALSVTRPWLDAVVYGDKRVENRTKWKGSSFRGPFLLHAATSMTRSYYKGVIHYLEQRGISWRPEPYEVLKNRQGILLAKARVADVILPGGYCHAGPGYCPSAASDERHPLADDPYYMGGFALVLHEKVELLSEPIPCKGMLGFFTVPSEVFHGETH